MTYEKRMQELESAEKYISRIGATQPHFRSGELGKLYELRVDTIINHQSCSGDQNYHTDKVFDTTLAEVITERFLDLAGEALILMETRANNALVAEEQALRERLRKIEEVKEKEAHA